MKYFLVFYVCMLGMEGWLMSDAMAASDETNNDRVVKLQAGVGVDDFLAANGLDSSEVEIGKNNYILVKGSEAGVQGSDNWELSADVQDDGLANIMTVPNDWYYKTEQWNLKKIGMEDAWDDVQGNDKIVVAVLDTGFNYNHEDLQDLLWVNKDEIADNGVDDDDNGYIDDRNGYNFVKGTNKVMDDNDHGSAVSSIIAANSNNKVGIAGVAWKATIMPVKVASASGSASLFDIAQGIYYAVDNGAKVINMSLGSTIDKDYMREAVQYASDRGVLMVAAAGNASSFSSSVLKLYYPANYTQVMAVGATGTDDKIATLSNSGFLSHHSDQLDLMAPGVDIVTANADATNEGYTYFDGTSMAAPQVVGAAVLLWSKDQNLTDREVRQILNESADKVSAMSGSFDDKYGNGRLNVAKALEMVDDNNSNDDDSDDIDDNDDDNNNSDNNNDSNDNNDEDNDNNSDNNDDNQVYGDFWQASWLGQSNYWYMKPGETRKVWVELKNVGTSLWQKTGYNALHLGTDQNKDRVSLFYDGNTWLTSDRISMVEDEVRPGEVARFEFEVRAPLSVGDYKEYFGLVAENKTWLNDMGMYWEFHVTNQNIYSSAWAGQSDFANLNLDEKESSWIEFVNNGTAAWTNGDINAVHLGTDHALDRSSKMYDAGTWLTSNRINMDQSVVQPGETARFSFDVKGNNEGFFREYFRPVVENVTWLNDQGVYLDYWVS